MVLLPWRSDSGVRGLFLVTPDHKQTGWHRGREHKTTHTHTLSQDKQSNPSQAKKQKHHVIAVSVLCLFLLEIKSTADDLSEKRSVKLIVSFSC